jgi:DNA-directed RNA polymerase subunit M/transcription elongation factor TFIIS
MLKEKFAPKTQEIIQSWQTFRSNTEPYKSKVEKELGAEEKLWCSTCGKEVERETQEARQQRIQQAIKNATQHIDDTNQKKQVEDQTREQERKKKLGKCGHDGELVCNWLLHYLHTFLLYYDKQDLNSFTKVEQIKRYEFGDNQLLRERLRELSDELYNSNIDLGNQLGTSLTKIANSLSEIKEEINAAEIQALRCQLDNLQNHLNQAQSQMGTLQGQIDSALSQLGSIRSGGGSRGGSSSSSGSSSLSQIRGTLNNITNEIQNELANLNSLINSAQGTVGNNRAAVTALNSIVYKYHDLVNKVNRLSNLVGSI